MQKMMGLFPKSFLEEFLKYLSQTSSFCWCKEKHSYVYVTWAGA